NQLQVERCAGAAGFGLAVVSSSSSAARTALAFKLAARTTGSPHCNHRRMTPSRPHAKPFPPKDSVEALSGFVHRRRLYARRQRLCPEGFFSSPWASDERAARVRSRVGDAQPRWHSLFTSFSQFAKMNRPASCRVDEVGLARNRDFPQLGAAAECRSK